MTAPPRQVCPRCGRLQPPLPSGVRHCLYCGTVLRRRHWTAVLPPAARGTAAARPPRGRTYAGPPRYAAPPRWGFAPSVWVPDRDPQDTTAPPLAALRTLAAACLLVAVLALVAAAAETVRLVLVLRGRTLVLDGAAVAASDLAVTAAGWTLLVVGTVVAVCVAAALVQAHAAAHRHRGVPPPRSATALWLRLLVPGWHLWGAGVVVLETEAVAAGRLSGSGLPRSSALVRWWWACWVASVVLVVVTALRGLAGTEQALLDGVQLHLAVDLLAAALAVLTAALLRRLRRELAPPSTTLGRRRVAPPDPTRAVLARPELARRSSGVLPPTGPTALPDLASIPVAPAGPGEPAGPDGPDAGSGDGQAADRTPGPARVP